MRKKQVPRRVKAFFILAAFVLVIFIKIFQVISVDILMDDIHHLEKERKNLYNETERLQAKINRLANIDKIRNHAERQLGLITNSDKIYYLKITDYNDLEKAKKNFAHRHQQEVKNLNLAGVH